MEDRKTAVETLHRERIMDASERLFLEKGFQGTTISDISEAADYSRRTIYAYFESKDEILCGVVARGLRMLRDELRAVLGEKLTFSEMYGKVCAAMRAYQERHPLSASRVNAAQAEGLAEDELTGGQRAVLELGSEINELMGTILAHGDCGGRRAKESACQAGGADAVGGNDIAAFACGGEGRIFRAGVRRFRGGILEVRL